MAIIPSKISSIINNFGCSWHLQYIPLWFLYSPGESYRSLAFGFRVSHNAICQLVVDVSEAIYEELKGEFFQVSVLTALTDISESNGNLNYLPNLM